MNDSTPENDEPTTFVETSKNLFRKHKPKVLAVGGAVGSVALAVIAASLAGGRGSENTEDQESLSAPETSDQSRRSSSDHDRDPFLRRLPAGQHASDEARARYKELTGNDLTSWLHLGSPVVFSEGVLRG
ncbi:hypothetical protein [Streptomyces sp. V4I2]|uniref:hypothetical protein n=1 Tax=Streptomyces sp. V4I2 TaxID=3042280 RepID=UPI0027D8C799|nr:hypothetical protein [Streptomyces sp. V4I2]